MHCGFWFLSFCLYFSHCVSIYVFFASCLCALNFSSVFTIACNLKVVKSIPCTSNGYNRPNLVEGNSWFHLTIHWVVHSIKLRDSITLLAFISSLSFHFCFLICSTIFLSKSFCYIIKKKLIRCDNMWFVVNN